ncbi:hypothetical protein BDY19DRAFT_1060274 [Irpex rosettiformis]|uniref:Uncharacterized protein n=1 Tax=Irpex rosettiformis TaxID=378272 RepID=A0ACB8TRX9_9APHY|nr:hypothetical protein BDY19DRAFT_1060274 [Irpex rosettiformis]
MAPVDAEGTPYKYTLAGRGRDPAALDALPDEQAQFTASVEDFLDNMKNPGQLVLPNADHTMSGRYPIHKMLVKESDDNKMELLIRRPTVKSHSVFGCDTQGYVAVEAQNSDVLFLKDSWRVHHELAKTETEIYRILERYGVPHIPRMICGGDVRGPGDNDPVQTTKSVEWIKRQDLPVGYAYLREHVHHRMVQRIAYPIEAATNSKQYTKAFYSAIQVIKRADGDECKILHRDISIGNVMFSGKDGEDDVGVLGDWDHARVTIPGEAREHQKFRTGTWLFMSIGLLQNPRKAHETLDDLESIFWTKLYGALHRFKHTGKIDIEVFTEKHHEMDAAGYTSTVVGGDRKYTILVNFPKIIKFSSRALDSLFLRLAEAIREYYDAKYSLYRVQSTAARYSYVDLDEDDLDEYSPISKARKVLEEKHAIVSDPQFWLNTFKSALDMKNGWRDDLMSEDPYPLRTEEQKTQQIENTLQRAFERKNQMEGSNTPGEDPDKLEFQEDPEVIESENDLVLIPTSYYRRGLDADDHEPVTQPAGASPSSRPPLGRQLDGSGAQTGAAFSSGSSSTESITEQRKRKHKDHGGKMVGSSKIRSESGPMQKRLRQMRVPASLPAAFDLSTRPQTRLATARHLSGEASVGASGMGRLSLSPVRRTQASLKGKDKAKGKGKGKETMRSHD